MTPNISFYSSFQALLTFGIFFISACDNPYEAPPEQHKPLIYEQSKSSERDTHYGKYCSDIAYSQEVIFCNDFDTDKLHTYTQEDILSKWNIGNHSGALQPNAIKIVRDPELNGIRGNSIQVYYAANKIGYSGNSGSNWRTRINGSHSDLYFAYDIFFSNDAEFVHGGKLPGLWGGNPPKAGTFIDGTDGWSGRIMWHENGKLVQYIYHAKKSRKWGHVLPWDDGVHGQVYLKKGQWNKLEMRYVMNTPGLLDGRAQAWLNGELCLDRTDVMFRMPGGESIGIDTLNFSTFYGGNTKDWAPPTNQYIYFDNFVVSTMPITHQPSQE